MSSRHAFLALLALSAPAAASAQGFATPSPVTGLYVAAGAGVNFAQNQALTAQGALGGALLAAGAGNTGRAIFEPGFAVVGSVGWGFGNGLRVEVEGSLRQNDVRKVGGFPGAGVALNGFGTQRLYGVMANAFYDFNLPFLGGFVPYVGAGVGYAWRDWSNVNTGVLGGTATLAVPSTSRGNLAWQAIIGAAYPLPFLLPGLSATAEYRYFGNSGVTYNNTTVFAPAPVVSGPLRADVAHNHSVLIGLRYAFDQRRPAPAPVVAPAPAPAPAAAPARTYLVFFDWDRADLTDRARQVISEAARAARTVQTTRIEVSGHADRTGTAQYNQRLSVRRAEAVAAELVRQGIRRDEIGIQGFGFERPLVPTAQGVREPQNRRVEIVLR